MAKKNLEAKVAEELLQEPLNVSIGKMTFAVPRPTLGTLVMVASDIAVLPEFSDEEKLSTVLADCVHGEAVARILAILILGSKKIRKQNVISLWPFRMTVPRLTRYILDNLTNSQIWEALSGILSTSELDDFFALTTFLRTVNLASARKVVNGKKKTTASGQSSQA